MAPTGYTPHLATDQRTRLGKGEQGAQHIRRMQPKLGRTRLMLVKVGQFPSTSSRFGPNRPDDCQNRARMRRFRSRFAITASIGSGPIDATQTWSALGRGVSEFAATPPILCGSPPKLGPCLPKVQPEACNFDRVQAKTARRLCQAWPKVLQVWSKPVQIWTSSGRSRPLFFLGGDTGKPPPRSGGRDAT